MAHMGCGNNNASPIDGVALAFWNRTFTVLRRHHRMRAERMAAYEKLNENRLFRAWLKLIIHSATILVAVETFPRRKSAAMSSWWIFYALCATNRKTAEDKRKWVAILMRKILDPFALIWIEKKNERFTVIEWHLRALGWGWIGIWNFWKLYWKKKVYQQLTFSSELKFIGLEPDLKQLNLKNLNFQAYYDFALNSTAIAIRAKIQFKRKSSIFIARRTCHNPNIPQNTQLSSASTFDATMRLKYVHCCFIAQHPRCFSQTKAIFSQTAFVLKELPQSDWAWEWSLIDRSNWSRIAVLTRPMTLPRAFW